MIKKDQIDRVMGMLREAKLAADADRRINYAHVCGRHRVSRHYFQVAVRLGYFERRAGTSKGRYKCNIDHIQPIHARRIIDYADDLLEKEDDRTPLGEYSTDELINELREREDIYGFFYMK